MKTNPFANLQKKLGYRFKKRALLQQALIHPSYAHEQSPAEPDNQRLEYLGDAALGFVSAAVLYKTRKEAPEGDLTKLRSSLASTETLQRLSRDLDVGKYLKLGRGETMSGGHARTGNLADALEAILGAAYLDGGIAAVEKIFKRVFMPLLKYPKAAAPVENPKGALQEWLQSHNRPLPHYRILHEEGPPHARVYDVVVMSDGHTLGRGTGSSKRAAESAAASQALSAFAI